MYYILFKTSKYGISKQPGTDKEFSLVMDKVLLPLALEKHLKSRSLEVLNTACQWAKKYDGQTAQELKDDDVEAVVGDDEEMKQTFLNAYGSDDGDADLPSDCTGGHQQSYSKITHAINQLNIKREENLILLFDYVKDQGWTKGSAIGSADHEMNRNGNGFTHAIFLLRNEFHARGKLQDLIDALKWYTDFNEVYQSPEFEYRGTTADRMRTLLLFRLLTILVMPEDTPEMKQEKVRDMKHWKRWYSNILKVNKGLGGLIKPDYTTFHHHTFYGSAYSPVALHIAALVQYLIEGTRFYDTTNTPNIKKALEVLKIASVKYSTPNSIGGRFPDYSRAFLARTVPAFAYLAVTSPLLVTNADNSKSLGDLGDLKTSEARTFLRLYDIGSANDCGEDDTADDRDVRALKQYLCRGEIESQIYYLTSLGSLQIMQKIKDKAAAVDEPLQPEASPEGHWAKNFGALSIHRREDWAVTVKGFNHFIWDKESSCTENVFGLYQSHGALLVANSEDDLKHHDVKNGWDWTRVPGTTSIGYNLKGLRTKDDRRYNKKSLAGGVTFSGRSTYSLSTLNGMFGMDFEQPDYQLPENSPMDGVNFLFKKSVMFHDNFIVCVGSGITASDLSNSENTYTTLFQDKVIGSGRQDSANDCRCKQGRKCRCHRSQESTPVHRCGTGSAQTPTDWDAGFAGVVLEDTKGNRFDFYCLIRFV